MKILGLVVIFVFFNYCSAAANRSTLWVLADEEMYSSNMGYQACTEASMGGSSGTASTTTVASNSFTLLTTTYFTITATDFFIVTTLASANGAGQSATVAGLNSLSLTFNFGDSVSTVTYGLTAFNALTTANSIATTLIAGTITSVSGNTWLIISNPTYSYNFATANANKWVTVTIADYKSNSTISIIQWQDGANTGGGIAACTACYNHLYMIIVRTATSYLTTSSDKLVAGCTSRGAGKRKRSISLEEIEKTIDNQIDQIENTKRRSKRGGSGCSTTDSTDSSLASTTLDSVCTNAGTTVSSLKTSIAASVNAMNTVRVTDAAAGFSKAGSKFTIVADFGILIAISSIIFNILN